LQGVERRTCLGAAKEKHRIQLSHGKGIADTCVRLSLVLAVSAADRQTPLRHEARNNRQLLENLVRASRGFAAGKIRNGDHSMIKFTLSAQVNFSRQVNIETGFPPSLSDYVFPNGMEFAVQPFE
jgi:hypothetical protein